ncbi:alpha-2-macroglobulin family protein [Luteolibacter marinus]|uniref:alpha-2-macroglobulin family protein n=1 Tax=Luteolibacter marinus TaxID=2776705 RepID=UPI001866045B|nr:MG2 domain-containing protein [Luteolibacter marinus]
MRPIAFLLAGLFLQGVSAAPRLHVSTPSLTPESNIDLVLDRAVAGEDLIGRETDNDWLAIKPSWQGRLFWKEANVAEFRPAAPPALGTTYVFSLKPGHRHLDGSKIDAGEVAKVASAGFQVDYATLLERYDRNWSPRTATYFLRFNGDVTPEKAAPFLIFEADGGKRVAARTERATFGRLKSPGYLGASWSERFARRGAEEPAEPVLTPELELPNGLVVSPLQPLPEGKNWRLSLLSGLPDASGKASFTADGTRHIGDIDPLAVQKLYARSVADGPRRIVADFNVRLPSDLPASLVKIEPQPAGYRLEVHNDELHLMGDFSTESAWHVTLSAALASADGRALGRDFAKKLVFKPVDPELALPSQDESQLASGIRQYRIQTVNLEKVHLRVKRLDGPQLIRAQQGYRHYTGVGPDGDSFSPTHLIPYELMNGETVADLEIELPNPLDTTQPILLDWDKVLAGDPRPWELGFPKDPAAPTPAVHPSAAFFVEVAGTPKAQSNAKKSPVAQALVQLTDIGLAWKIIDGEARVLAFSCLTGQPLPDVDLATFGEDAKPLQQSKTGPDGMAVLPREDAARHLQATLGEDRYSIAYDTTLPTVGLWRFPVRYSWNETPLEFRKVFLFTDRSLYRPGETVHLKGIVRRQEGNAITAAPAAAAQLVVTDPRNKEILRRDAEISPTGGFDLTFKLPDGTTGYHRAKLEYPAELAGLEGEDSWSERNRILSNASFSIGLRVEEFRRNAFELTHTVENPAPGAKEVSLLLKAAYYQGQPVAKGSVGQFTHIEETNFYPERYRDYLFGDHRTPDFGYWYHYFGYRWDDDHGSRRADNESTEAELADDGTVRITASLPDAEFPVAREVSISTEVTDANRQTLSKTSEVTVHPASVYVGIARLDRLVRAGDHLPLAIVAVTPDGKPYQGELSIEARMSREINEQVRLSDGHGGTAVRNEARREELSTTPLQLSGGQGTELLFSPREAGLHQIELRGTDPEGRAFATAMSIHVYGGDQYPWAYEDGIRIKLVAEKKHYKPGETARVLVLSPIEGTALVTVEREKVLRSFQVELKADKPVIEIPVGDDDAPNAFVSVLVIKGAQESARVFKEPQLRLGYCELTVENVRDTLAVKLEVPADSVLPGQQVDIAGTVLLADGSPAANAEVTLYAEDEGTLAVMGYETPDPMSWFYDPRELRVNCGTTLDHFIAESPDEQSFFNKGFFVGGGDSELGALRDRERRDFNPCAGWQPALTTGADGRFTATFTMPDTLTRYRVIAVAHHDVAKFGRGQADLVVKKPLMVEPQAPRFASEGDELGIRALVQNASGFNGTWKVTFSANPPASDPVAALTGSGTEQLVTLDSGASATVLFPVKFHNTGEAVFSWKAEPVSLADQELTPVLAGKLRDQVEARFPVTYPVPLLRQSKLVRLDNRQANLLENLDPDLLAGRGQLELEFSRSLLMEAAGSVDYLLHYPYGCVEQTTSSMMPWFAVDQLRDVVPSFAKYTPEKVQDALQAGVDRLLSMQTRDGGFSYWPGGEETVDWATSYAGLGLILADKAGASVPPAAIAALGNNLEAGLRGISSTNSAYAIENACRAVWILALADRKPDAYLNTLKDRMADLNPRARCLLALAAKASGNGDPAAILRDKTKFRLNDDSWMRWRAGQSLDLLAWSAVAPEGAETTAALEKLIRERNPYGHWNTTWANGWSLLALASYAENHDDSGPAAVTLTSADGSQPVTLAPDQPPATFDYPLGPSLALSATSDKPAYVRVKLASKPDLVPQKPVAKNGLEITRFYARLKPDGTTEPLAAAHVGDLVRVTLRLELPDDDTRYLVVEDRLPAIFEAVNNDFESQAAHGNAGPTSENDWTVSHSEIRGDRAVFFFDRVWHRGTKEISYLARCTMSGKAVAPPAKVESMYDPDNTALSASREF